MAYHKFPTGSAAAHGHHGHHHGHHHRRSPVIVIVTTLLLVAVATVILVNRGGLPELKGVKVSLAKAENPITGEVEAAGTVVPHETSGLSHLMELAKEDLRISAAEKDQLSKQGKVLNDILTNLAIDSQTGSTLLRQFEALAGKLGHLEEHLEAATAATTSLPTSGRQLNLDSSLKDKVLPVNPEDIAPDTWLELGKSAPECQDMDKRCADWAASGECKSNAAFMAKTCRLSCGVPCVPEQLWRQQVVREQLSWQPRAYLMHRILHPAECEYIIKLATPELERSHVMEHDTGKELVDPIRDSWGMFMTGDNENDPVVLSVAHRVAHFSMVPHQFGENMQVLRYNKGQHYFAHGDYFKTQPPAGHGDHPGSPGQQRIATMLMYLRSVEEGGETHFPYGKPLPGSSPPPNATCGTIPKKGLSVNPVQGNAVLFFSRRPNGDMDIRSTHASCPVVKGQKWSATKWIRDGSLELTWKPDGDPVYGETANTEEQFLDGSRRR